MRKRFYVWGIGIILVLVATTSVFCELDKKRKDEVYRQVELFADALTAIEGYYVEEKPVKDLIYGALSGMLDSLDPYSQFLNPEEYNELKVETKGQFGGIGIEISKKDGLLTVISPIEDTPAWKAGIKPMDRIVKIDNELTKDFSLSDAVRRLRGEPGKPVVVTILREGLDKLMDVSIVRDIIKIQEIKNTQVLEDNIGYIRVVEFGERTADELKTALQDLKKQNCDSLILDLRNNPGGLLDVAVKTTELFLEPNKMIVSTKGRSEKQQLEFKSTFSEPYLAWPMIVLVNEGSASASEILAGALQDYKRALLVGEKTFGKGSVQTILPLSDGSALRITTSQYFTPLNRSIHKEGIKPDIVVSYYKIEKEGKKEGLNDLSDEIFDKVGKVEEQEKKEEEKIEKPPQQFNYKDDSQVMRSVELLKGIKIYAASKK